MSVFGDYIRQVREKKRETDRRFSLRQVAERIGTAVGNAMITAVLFWVLPVSWTAGFSAAIGVIVAIQLIALAFAIVDLRILGIGTDGHIAFNEPGSSLASRTRIKTLTHQTRVDNARFFGNDLDAVPTHCLTQGLGTIMSARHVVLVATGRGKAEAVHHMAEGAVTAMWPGSILQHHPHVTVLLDGAAASRLQLIDYYREAYRSKPQWQGI